MWSLPGWLLAGLVGMSMSVAPALAAPPGDDDTSPGDDILSYPLAEGDYSSRGSSYFAWIFFTTPDGVACGLAPNGGPVGCDAVPSDAPAGTNQIVATSSAPAEYRRSATASFTREANVLPTGQRVQTLGGACAVDYQGAVHCESGSHGFILSADAGVLW